MKNLAASRSIDKRIHLRHRIHKLIYNGDARQQHKKASSAAATDMALCGSLINRRYTPAGDRQHVSFQGIGRWGRHRHSSPIIVTAETKRVCVQFPGKETTKTYLAPKMRGD